jgi:hypothetical protein
MPESNAQPLGWVWIIAIMLLVGVGLGALLGFVGGMVGLPPAVTTAGVGAAVGIVGAILISRRKQGA